MQAGEGLTITPSGLHAGWPAGLGGTGLAVDQLDPDRERGLAVANGSRFWCPRREISSTRLESPRERR